MKVRAGFVSNSSSCSFICELCGEDKFAWDWDNPNDHGMIVCERKHMICIDHVRSVLDRCEVNQYREKVLSSRDCPLCINESADANTWQVRNIISSKYCVHRNEDIGCDILMADCEKSECPLIVL